MDIFDLVFVFASWTALGLYAGIGFFALGWGFDLPGATGRTAGAPGPSDRAHPDRSRTAR